MNNSPDPRGTSADRSDTRDHETDLLISRVVDGEASPAEWVLLQAQASALPALWKQLACTYREAQVLEAVVDQASQRIERIGLPAEVGDGAWVAGQQAAVQHAAHGGGAPSRRQPRHARTQRVLAHWGGWAAAAALSLALVLRVGGLWGGGGAPAGATPGAVQGAGLAGASLSSAADALQAYLDRGTQEGTVVGQVPAKMLVQSTPLGQNGIDGYEVVYIRQIVEKVRVPHLYRVSTDEAGNPTPIRHHPGLALPGTGAPPTTRELY